MTAGVRRAGGKALAGAAPGDGDDARDAATRAPDVSRASWRRWWPARAPESSAAQPAGQSRSRGSPRSRPSHRPRTRRPQRPSTVAVQPNGRCGGQSEGRDRAAHSRRRPRRRESPARASETPAPAQDHRPRRVPSRRSPGPYRSRPPLWMAPLAPSSTPRPPARPRQSDSALRTQLLALTCNVTGNPDAVQRTS